MRTLALSLLLAAPTFAATCESLSTLKLENGTVTSAAVVAPGTFQVPEIGRAHV